MGDKARAKELLSKYAPHISLIPGYSGLQDDNILIEESKKIGFYLFYILLIIFYKDFLFY